ncbi:uncharacterized protein TNCV_1258731 [Trichonephila clavipes]|nr:uncharacterized protein TNCV_1258731 [Trichonephila clavipes]
MRYDRALRHTSSVWCLATFPSIFAVTLHLVRSNSCDAQLAILKDPRYAGLETNMGIGQSKKGFVAKEDLVPFRCNPVSSCAATLQTDASSVAHVMGTAIPNILQPGAFVWFEKTQGLQVKVLPVPGWWPMKQLAVHVHFL